MKKIIFKEKKIKKLLYEGYKENKKILEQTELEENNPHEIMGITHPIQDKKDKKQKKIPKLKITQTIAIASLDSKCGCTYITQALAKYIKTMANPNICIVDMTGKNSINNNQISTYKSADICNLYDEYQYIVIDMGNLKERSDLEINEYKRANIKIMISKLEDDYLRQLATYIKEDKNSAMKWAFLFNLVPQGQKRKVDVLMEDYEYYCLSLIDKDNLDDETKKIFHNILIHKRGE